MPSYENFQLARKADHEQTKGPQEQAAQRNQPRHGEVPAESLEPIDLTPRPTLVDGHIRGLECNQLSLTSFNEASSFQECYFDTQSGNIYVLLKIPEGGLFMADARSNIGKGDGMRGNLVSENEMSQAVLEVGQPLRLANSNTSVIKRIIVVTDARFTTGEASPEQAREIAQEQTEGRTSNIRRQFKESVYAGL